VGDLESTTPASHATIGTGVYPRKHNVIGFGWRDPATGRFTYAPTNTNQIHAGYLEKTMTADGVPTLSDEVHLHNPLDRVVSISGEKYYAAATIGAGADYQLYGWFGERQVPAAGDWPGHATRPYSFPDGDVVEFLFRPARRLRR